MVVCILRLSLALKAELWRWWSVSNGEDDGGDGGVDDGEDDGYGGGDDDDAEVFVCAEQGL